MKQPRTILFIIVFSQFCCTSLWFAGNGILNDLILNFDLDQDVLGVLTSAVQLGFISGTLLFALFTIADRFSPSKVFFISSILAAASNMLIIFQGNTLFTILIFRFFVGFFLAGIYPVGMKIAADYFEKGLGKALGFLVGALVLGTAFPHLLKELTAGLPWKSVLIATSSLALLGGALMMTLVPDGPYRKSITKLELLASFSGFRNKSFRSAAMGYFGHMWELYAFWAFVPVMIRLFNEDHGNSSLNVPLLSFAVIGIGSLSCVLGAFIAERAGTKRTAFGALLLSGICCVFYPLMAGSSSTILFVVFLLIWGMTVIADSPLFSTLVAQNAPADIKGSAITIVTSIGFSITIVSIQFINAMQTWWDSKSIFVLLAIGPAIGLIAMLTSSKNSSINPSKPTTQSL